MNFINENLEEYILAHSEEEPILLQELNRETYSKVLHPRMLAGHYQGRVLSMLSKMIQPKQVLEIGTFTGYSAISFAEGLKRGGKIHTIEINEELESRAKHYFKKTKNTKKIQLYIGNALTIIPAIERHFDLVYIDADKENYCNYYDLVFNKVKKGGYIIADNVLWGGKVLEINRDKDTQALVEYNKKVQKDKRVENILFPIRDGLMICRKR